MSFIFNGGNVFAQQDPRVSSRAALLMELQSGQILWSKELDKIQPPASITKLMTYHLVMDAVEVGKIALEDRVIISEMAAGERGTRYNLEAGETVSLEKLIEAMMIVSGNDAAFAIGEYVEGSKAAFVKRMNEEAQRLGMKDTYFVNPHGLPESGKENMSSARDVAILSKYLIERYEKHLLEVTAMENFEDPQREIYRKNTNNLLKVLPGVDGLKTGFTNAAGFCLVSTLGIEPEKEGEESFRLIAVVLGAPNDQQRVADSKNILEYGKQNFTRQKVFGAGDVVERIYLWNMADLELGLTLEQDLSLFGPKTGIIKKQDIQMSEDISFPLKAGDKVGELRLTLYDDQELHVDLISDRTYNRLPIRARMTRWWWGFSGLLVGLLDRVLG